MSVSVARRTALVVVLLALGTSCASIPSTNYYVLGLPREPDRTGVEAKYPYSVFIAPLESEPLYLRKKIVWRSQANRVGYYSYERWATLPAEMFAFRLYERFHSAGLFESVRTEGSSEAADLLISGKIIFFEDLTTANGQCGRVEAKIEIADRSGTVIWSGIESHSEPVSGQGVGAVVRAIAEATDIVIQKTMESIDLSLEDSEL